MFSRADALEACLVPGALAAESIIERAFEIAIGLKRGEALVKVGPLDTFVLSSARRDSKLSAGSSTLRDFRLGATSVVWLNIPKVGAIAMCAHGPGKPKLTGAGFGGGLAI